VSLKWFLLLFFLVLVPDCLRAGISTDGELTRLERVLEEANTQTELNIAAREISLYLETRLEAAETETAALLSEEQRLLFSQSCDAWRTYRDTFTDAWSMEYEGGSMQPLVYGMCKSRMTKTRIEELELLCDEIKSH